MERAEAQAQALRAELERRSEAMHRAEGEAADADEREQKVSGELAAGQARSAALGKAVDSSAVRLRMERRRLARARQKLAERLVAIYRVGSAENLGIAAAAADYGDLVTRAEYMQQIEQADDLLVDRVVKTQTDVASRLEELKDNRAEAERHELELEQAHAQISEIRVRAEARAASLATATEQRNTALKRLTSNLGVWAKEIDRAEAREAKEAGRASSGGGSGEAEVERWLGGPYSIPTAIVMCESGGNYSALNASSGAGGAYQIMPATWASYGGKGAPHEAPKAEQDRIAALIWRDSGPGAWVCKG